MKEQILNHLSPQYPWGETFHYFEEVSSTNDLLKTLARQGAPEGTVLMADRQTGGHGRLGRSFHSPGSAGIYLSILLRPDCAPTELMHLTCAAAVAMCNAVEAAIGLRPGIKWTNDLVWGKRKLGGILTELGFTPQGRVDHAIIGIGLNCRQKPEDFPPEIQPMAASLSMASGQDADRAVITAAMLDALWKMKQTLLSGKQQMLAQYRRDCVTLEKDVSILRGEDVRHAHVLDMDDAGALIVRYANGTLETVSSGEVSVRGMYGYL